MQTLTDHVAPATESHSRHWADVLGYRAVARVVDGVLTLVVAAGVAAVTTFLQFLGTLFALDWLHDGAEWVRPLAAVASAAVFHLWNNVVGVYARGASIGKSFLGLRITREGGGRLPPALAFVREVIAAGVLWVAVVIDPPHYRIGWLTESLHLPVVVAVVLAVIHLGAALADTRRRTLHDRLVGSVAFSSDASTPPGIHRDVRVFQVIGQIVAVVVVWTFVRWLVGNLFDNLDEANFRTDFDFLDGPTNFQIPFDDGFDDRSSVRSMYVVGIKNTFLAASVGIVLATILGTIIGIARLSSNWLVARLATMYVEFLRNIPPLVVIIFFGAAVFTFGPFPVLSGTSRPWTYRLPGSDETFLIVSKTVWGIPSLARDGKTLAFWILAFASLAVAAAVWWWRTRLNVRTGAPHHRVLWSAGVFVVLVVLAFWLTSTPYRISWATVSENGRRINGGFVMNFGWISVTIALALYTASHIAEIIRGSILAVSKGQTEAANALSLSSFQRYRYVVLPQAARIAIPPTINQYLNLTKNTSLGVAVAYADITAITQTSIGNGRPAVQSLVLLMLIYLTFSLTISFVMNRVNRRVQLVGR